MSAATARRGAGPGGSLLAILFCSLIAAISVHPGWSYLLFPELAALSSAVLNDPLGAWARRPGQLILLPTLTAVTGLWISLHGPAGGAGVLLAVLGARLLLLLFRSALAPALSAAALPVLLGIHSWAYPLQIGLGLLGLGALLQWRRRRLGPAPPQDTADGPPRPQLRGLLLWGLYLAAMLVLGELCGLPTLLLPPLIVISHEALVAPRPCSWRQRSWVVPLSCGCSAVIGVLAARLCGGHPGLATALSMVCGLALLRALRLQLPPVFAMGVLPLLLPSPGIRFVLEALIGATCLAGLVRLLPGPPPAAPQGIANRQGD